LTTAMIFGLLSGLFSVFVKISHVLLPLISRHAAKVDLTGLEEEVQSLVRLGVVPVSGVIVVVPPLPKIIAVVKIW
jgi:peptidoglycan biosynthesis protein MviN/MurJ (putative lipid II flippase)